MAYKFQFGTARLSGALEQEGNVTIATGSSDVIGVESSLGSGQFLAQLKFDGSSGVDSGVLELVSGSGNTSFYAGEKLSGSALATLAGAALDFNQGSGIMDVTNSGVAGLITDTAVAVNADSIVYFDATDNTLKRDSFADYAAALATGNGIDAAAGSLFLDLHELVATNVDVSADSIAIVDADASNSTRKESIADLVTAMVAGDNGLAASSGVISVQTSGAVNLDGDKVGISGSIAGSGLAYAGGVDAISELSLDLNELTAETIASGDFLPFVDSTDNGTHKETVDDLATLFAGNGLTAASAVMALDLHELSAVQIASGDFLPIVDSTDNSTKKESIDDIATLFAGNGLTAASAVMALDLHELTAVQIASGDFLPIVDSSDNSTKKESIDDIATLFAGDGLAASSAVLAVQVSGAVHVSNDKVSISGSIAGNGLAYGGGVDSISELSLDLNELSAGTVADGDFFTFIDTDDSNNTKKEAIADLASLFAGAGMTATNSVMNVIATANGGLGVAANSVGLDMDTLSAATINVADDSFAFIDATDDTTKKDTIADLVSAMAGAGLAASSGVLSVQSNNITDFTGNHTAVEGFNYADADFSSDVTVTLPGSPTIGDVVRVKAKDLTNGANIIIARAGSHTIDGETSIRIESPFGAVSCVYVKANEWRIF